MSGLLDHPAALIVLTAVAVPAVVALTCKYTVAYLELSGYRPLKERIAGPQMTYVRVGWPGRRCYELTCWRCDHLSFSRSRRAMRHAASNHPRVCPDHPGQQGGG